MKPATITFGAVLFLVVGTSSAIILRQHARIEELRARLDSAAATRAVTPAPMVIATEEPATESPTLEETPAPQTGASELRPVGTEGELVQRRSALRARGANRFAELLADPEIATLMMGQRKGELDGRYAALFKKLNLSPSEIDALKNLLAEKHLARMEAGAVARAEGLGREDREGMRELIQESDDEVEARMRQLLGSDRYAELQEYESTAPQRARVQQLDLRLSYSQTPLQPYQSEAMVDILASSPPEPRSGGRNSSAEEAAAYISELQAYDAQIYTKAQSVLNGAQLEALRQMQRERMDRLRLNALMRRRGEGGG